MMNITLLAAQAALADTLAGGNPVLTPVSEEARMNLWDMAMKGGWIMLVLALLSVVCFYIFFERMAVIRKAGKDDPLFMERIRDYIRTGEIKSAINYCRITNTPSARMIEKGITRMGRPVADVQAAIENSGNIEVAKLENGLPVVATIAGGAPMIGFLGTVTGMVQAFWEMSNAGNNNADCTVSRRLSAARLAFPLSKTTAAVAKGAVSLRYSAAAPPKSVKNNTNASSSALPLAFNREIS